ncbi:peptidoglycan recognition protein 3-like [Macrosteles quadrilineatus]|uniref:peptidoglycan recognition protein 3-like n=1 Tax=Macrosteles quadrilineatus TaxID=74068 RepID=UPI0023E11F10|nr:peptidoglycan recognition protein 3-like [Macrosteles quadrilineatus]
MDDNSNLPPLKVISREEWGARPTISTRKFKDLPLRFAVLSLTTRTKECRSLEECCRMMRRIQHMDMAKRGLKDIRYNFYLGSDGNAYEGRGWKVIPPNNNKYQGRQGQYIHIVCIGDFRSRFTSLGERSRDQFQCTKPSGISLLWRRKKKF